MFFLSIMTASTRASTLRGTGRTTQLARNPGRLHNAVNAFFEVERTSLLLDKKMQALVEALKGMDPADQGDYFRQTEQISKDFQEKRDKLKE